ncbi:MAG: helix-turn-helix transcriptional regulator [Ruminococcaceae bacterium]|nr:helix-turn-helix transcriptional regulator [Oscillospiraceae bacterium]
MTLAENIANCRNAAGETQGQLAELLGVSNRTVSKWENAEGEPDVAAMMKIAEHYGVTLDELCGFDGKKAEKKAELSPNEVALRAFSESFDVLKRLRTDMSTGEDDGFVPPSLLKEDYQKGGCRATGVFFDRIYSLFVNSKENNMVLTLLRNSENFGWINGFAEDFNVLLGFIADADIRKLLSTMLTDTFPFRFTAEYAAEKAEIALEKAEKFLDYAVWEEDVELIEGDKKVYMALEPAKAGMYMGILCCAYEILREESSPYFEVWNAGSQPIIGEKQEG